MSSSGKLGGKIALITGGGSGFGEGIVRKFVSEGARVLIMDINSDDALKVARSAAKGIVASIQGDVSKEIDWKAALTKCLSVFGGLDIVVNNAGVLHLAQPSSDVSEDEYDRIMRINVKQIFWSCKVITPYFVGEKRSGVFVNISSMSASRPRPNLVWYAASKGAVNSVGLLPFTIRLSDQANHSSRQLEVWQRNMPRTIFASTQSCRQ